MLIAGAPRVNVPPGRTVVGLALEFLGATGAVTSENGLPSRRHNFQTRTRPLGKNHRPLDGCGRPSCKKLKSRGQLHIRTKERL